MQSFKRYYRSRKIKYYWNFRNGNKKQINFKIIMIIKNVLIIVYYAKNLWIIQKSYKKKHNK